MKLSEKILEMLHLVSNMLLKNLLTNDMIFNLLEKKLCSN